MRVHHGKPKLVPVTAKVTDTECQRIEALARHAGTSRSACLRELLTLALDQRLSALAADPQSYARFTSELDAGAKRV
jgi:hypothetical protein